MQGTERWMVQVTEGLLDDFNDCISITLVVGQNVLLCDTYFRNKVEAGCSYLFGNAT